MWGSPTIDLFAMKLNNRLTQYMSPLPDPKALEGINLGVYCCMMVSSECLGRIMGQHECLRISFNPSHSGSAEQGNDGQGLLVSDRPLLTQPTMVPNLLELLSDHPRGLPSFGTL
jgi:hypothetical protein